MSAVEQHPLSPPWGAVEDPGGGEMIMSIASSEQRPTKRRWFGAGFPHIPTPMILLAAAGAVALLILSRGSGSPEQAARSEEPHSFLTQVKASIDPLTHWQPRSGAIRI